MNNIPKIIKVEPLENMILLVVFEDGTRKLYNMKPLINKMEIFSELQNKSLFNMVKVDTGGYGIVWNDEIDLSKYEIWNNGKID
jgi:hypothetical protein